jgi:hypothetical protein
MQCNVMIEEDYNFTQLGGHADFLRPFIWSRLSGLLRFHDVSDNGYALNVVQISEKLRRRLWLRLRLRQAFEKEIMSRTRMF